MAEEIKETPEEQGKKISKKDLKNDIKRLYIHCNALYLIVIALFIAIALIGNMLYNMQKEIKQNQQVEGKRR
jgi:hypothetical protein